MKKLQKKIYKNLKKNWGIIQIAWKIYNYISMIIELTQNVFLTKKWVEYLPTYHYFTI